MLEITKEELIMKCYKCEREIKKEEPVFQGCFYSEENNHGNRSNHKSPIYSFCCTCVSLITEYQSKHSKREDFPIKNAPDLKTLCQGVPTPSFNHVVKDDGEILVEFRK